MDTWPEHKSDEIVWIPPTDKLKRPKWWKRKVMTRVPGYYKGRYGEEFDSMKKALNEMRDKEAYKLVDTMDKKSGPDRMELRRKAGIQYTVVGGKYVGKHRVDFDSTEEMEKEVAEMIVTTSL